MRDWSIHCEGFFCLSISFSQSRMNRSDNRLSSCWLILRCQKVIWPTGSFVYFAFYVLELLLFKSLVAYCMKLHHISLLPESSSKPFLTSLRCVLMPATDYYIDVDNSDFLSLSCQQCVYLALMKRLICTEMLMVKLGFGPEICAEHIQGGHLA